MKKTISFVALAVLFSCSKKDALETTASGNYQIRIAAVETSGAKSYTPISRVKSGKVAVEFESDEADAVKEYNVEISADGVTFKNVKTIVADAKTPNKFYRDTVVLQ